MNPSSSSAIRHFKIEESLSLKHWWEQHAFQEAELEKLLSLGAIFRNGSRLADWDFEDSPLVPEDILRVHFSPRRYFWRPDLVASWVLHETEHSLLVRKPAGLPTHPTLDNTKENLLHHLHAAGHPEALMVHRLDVGTDGLILFAKNKTAQKFLGAQFEDRSIIKIYSALTPVWENPPPRLEHWMKNADRAPRELFHEPSIDRKLCRLYITDEKSFEHQGEFYSALEIRLETGRTHQIRAQLSRSGYPILGDRMYGSSYSWSAPLVEAAHLTTESWALRCQQMQWEEPESIQHFEIEALSLEDLKARTPASVLSQ